MEELLKQILRDIHKMNTDLNSLKLEMHDRFNEIKNHMESSHIESIKADELILKTLLEHKSVVTDELVTYDHQFKVINNDLLRVKTDIDKLINR